MTKLEIIATIVSIIALIFSVLVLVLFLSGCNHIAIGQEDIAFTDPEISCTEYEFSYFYKSRPFVIGDPGFLVQRIKWTDNGIVKYQVEILMPQGFLDRHEWTTSREHSGSMEFEWGAGHIEDVCYSARSCVYNADRWGEISGWNTSDKVFNQVHFEKSSKWSMEYDGKDCTVEIRKQN